MKPSRKSVYTMGNVELAAELNKISEAYIHAVNVNADNLADIRHRLQQVRKESQMRYSRKWRS